uniref:Endonuclease/exonuclease/phosphatase domain-containing protein n=1 Tax=Octopus bimaculoides TaxID=37653 RepID=A0A0L8I2Z8_OCTBM
MVVSVESKGTCKIHVCEIRFVDTGELEVQSGYICFWSVKLTRIQGVDFTIKLTLIHKLPSIPQAVDECLMTFRVSIGNSLSMYIIGAYALTLSLSEQEHKIFYSKLQTVVSKIPYNNKVILMDDLNARRGNKYSVVKSNRKTQNWKDECKWFTTAVFLSTVWSNNYKHSVSAGR